MDNWGDANPHSYELRGSISTDVSDAASVTSVDSEMEPKLEWGPQKKKIPRGETQRKSQRKKTQRKKAQQKKAQRKKAQRKTQTRTQQEQAHDQIQRQLQVQKYLGSMSVILLNPSLWAKPIAQAIKSLGESLLQCFK